MKSDGKPQLKAVIFDMDGTLLDSREFIYQAMEDVLRSFGVEGVTRGHLNEVTGKPVQAMYQILAPGQDVAAMEQAHLAHHAEHMHLLKEYDHVDEVLHHLQTRGLKLGVFTGFDQTSYERLEQFGLRDLFGSIVESTRYSKHKPDPEGLLLCMQELGVKPSETAYVGDGISDIQAGKNAGVGLVVGITHGFGNRQALQAAGADCTVDSFYELGELLMAYK